MNQNNDDVVVGELEQLRPDEYTVEQLEDMLRAAKAREESKRQELRNSVEPVYEFTLFPVKLTHFGDECWDDTIVGWRLEGRVVNREECEAVGHTRLHEGGMTYIYNTGTKKFVMTTGGGTSWITTRPVFSRDQGIVDHGFETLDRLVDFIQYNPEGGKVTELINLHRAVQRGL